MNRRLLKMYIRNSDGVFVAVEGFQYGESLVFISKSVYTIASHFAGFEDSEIILEKVK